MKQASIWIVGIFLGGVFAIASILTAASGSLAFAALADENPSPCAYLPLASDQASSVLMPANTSAATMQSLTSWYGIVRARVDDWPVIRENLGGSVTDLIVRPHTSSSDIILHLDSAEAMGYQVILHIYDENTSTNKPWYLDANGEWVFPQSAIDMLGAVSGHPAIMAVYALHEPLDGGVTYVGVEQQRELYNLLKLHTGGLPVYTDIGSLAVFEGRGEPLTDGMCDYCATFPCHFRSDWTSEQCLRETLYRIDVDLDAQRRLMPGSQVVFLINTYAFADYPVPMRLPTSYELRVVRDYLCDLDQPMLYYPWRHSGYDTTLENAPELWPVIAEGCSGQPSTAESIIIDHEAVDADVIPQVWLDEARVLDTFFTHKSIGNNILAGVAALETGDPGRYSISVVYGTGSGSGITHYQVGSNEDPQSKIDGFEGLIRGGAVRDAAFMKFCVSDLPPWASVSPEAVWASYRDMMAGLQADYTDTVFVWWTAPLATASDNRGNGEKAVYNGLVRSYVEENGGVLFDVADIESHDPSGNAVVGPTGHEAMYDGYSDDGAHLNEVGSQRVARGMWWLLARIAGWPGLPISEPDWISVTAVTDVASVYAGQVATYTLSVSASDGFTEPVTLGLAGEPSGTTGSFTPNPAVAPADSQLSITTTASTVAGTYPMTVTGTSSMLSDTVDLTLIVASAVPPSFTLAVSPTIVASKAGEVAAFTVSVSANEALTEPVTLDLTGEPSGTTVSFDPNPVVAPGDSQLSITTTASTVAGIYPMTVTGTSGVLTGTADLTLIVASAAPPSFTLAISPTIGVAKPNQVITYTASITGVEGFSQPVNLMVVGLPREVSPAWSVNPVTPDGSSNLTLSVPSRPSFGKHQFYVVGTSGVQVVTRSAKLIIDYPYRSYLPIILKGLIPYAPVGSTDDNYKGQDGMLKGSAVP